MALILIEKLHLIHRLKSTRRMAIYRCTYCAKEVERIYPSKTDSCGCQSAIKLRNTLSNYGYQFDQYSSSIMRRRLYRKWLHINKTDNFYPDWKFYSLFKEWSLSEGHYNKHKKFLARYDNEEGYSPSNCFFTDRCTYYSKCKEHYGISYDKANMIRSLYQDGDDVHSLAEIFKTTKKVIKKIINNKIFVEKYKEEFDLID